MNKKRKLYSGFMRGAMYVCSAATVVLLLFMLGYVLIKGLPNISWEFLSSKPSYLTEKIGILPDMEYKRILTIQDISCVGQCSMTVALPILSACGLETSILPSAVLSTHTAGFFGYTFRDLTDDMPKILEHWKKEKISFSAVYTGYLGSAKQIEIVKDSFKNTLKDDGKIIVDPAMADNGKLYSGFDMDYVKEMKKLISEADIILPNITEASLLTGVSYREQYDEGYIKELISELHASGVPAVILTGVGYSPEYSGVIVSEGGSLQYYRHEKISKGCHGTGDIYSAAFTGSVVSGRSLYDAAVIAADFTVECIKNTVSDPGHWYGVKFEPILTELIEKLKKGEHNHEKQI